MPRVIEIKGRSNPGFDVDFRGVVDDVFVVTINGTNFGYLPKGMSIDDLAEKAIKIGKFSAGRAISFLKKNATLVRNPPDVGAFVKRLMASVETYEIDMLPVSETPTPVVAARNAQKDLLSASAWLKLARKSADDQSTIAELDDLEFDVTNVRKALDGIQKSVSRRNPKSSRASLNQLVRLR